MYVLIYQESNQVDVVQDEEGNTVFGTYEDVMALKCSMVVEGFDPADYKIARISFLD